MVDLSNIKISMATTHWGKQLRLRIDVEDPNYYGMKKLKLSGKDLSDIPLKVFNMIELEVLDLSPERQACLYYRLTYVPSAIGKLVNLKILMLDTNALTEIPPEIALCVGLERLALSNNQLSSLPAEIANLRNLKSLHAANNVFKEIPSQVCKIKSLEFLDFSDNEIEVIPGEISNLENLESLLLLYNKISVLPDSICQLMKLRVLWLGGNKLRTLPREMGKMPLLDWGIMYTSSILDGNPLVSPPIEVCRGGTHQIARYFELANAGRSGARVTQVK